MIWFIIHLILLSQFQYLVVCVFYDYFNFTIDFRGPRLQGSSVGLQIQLNVCEGKSTV